MDVNKMRKPLIKIQSRKTGRKTNKQSQKKYGINQTHWNNKIKQIDEKMCPNDHNLCCSWHIVECAFCAISLSLQFISLIHYNIFKIN